MFTVLSSCLLYPIITIQWYKKYIEIKIHDKTRIVFWIKMLMWRNILSTRRSASSPDETLGRELKIRRAAEYFCRTSRRFIWWWITLSNAWYYFSNKMILEGEINDAKIAVFRLISKFSLNINFLRIFFMKKRSKVRNIRKKYRRQIMLTTPI